MAKKSSLASRLYRGDVSYDIVGNRKRWYMLSGVILLLALVGLFGRGLNLGIEFEGGAEFQVPSANCSVEQVRDTATTGGATNPIVTELGDTRIRVQTEELSSEQSQQLVQSLATTCDSTPAEVKIQLVGSTWGGEITNKAVQGLVIFLIAVTLFLTLYFEWRMAVAALVALTHDVVITIGIYALVGFEVTPATVIGLLTILGFSLYDTVVVFDKVKENTRGLTAQSKMTYSDAANLAVNQTIVRSINTSIVALLPVGAILFVGAGLLGAGTLKDLALALFIGTAAGTYSSIFVATPFLCQLKEREPQMKALASRVATRRSGLDRKAAESAGKLAAAGSVSDGEAGGTAAGTSAPGATGGTTDGARKERSHRNQPKNQTRSKRGKS
ncbi:MAG: preprotein translocase subunit SecF [Actinomycetes bacterium]